MTSSSRNSGVLGILAILAVVLGLFLFLELKETLCYSAKISIAFYTFRIGIAYHVFSRGPCPYLYLTW